MDPLPGEVPAGRNQVCCAHRPGDLGAGVMEERLPPPSLPVQISRGPAGEPPLVQPPSEEGLRGSPPLLLAASPSCVLRLEHPGVFCTGCHIPVLVFSPGEMISSRARAHVTPPPPTASQCWACAGPLVRGVD